MSGRLFLLGWVIMMSILVYGFVKYPNAPIRERGGKYIDKAGTEFNEEEFRKFKMWETTILGGGIAFFWFDGPVKGYLWSLCRCN